jgi:hypothetical protein
MPPCQSTFLHSAKSSQYLYSAIIPKPACLKNSDIHKTKIRGVWGRGNTFREYRQDGQGGPSPPKVSFESDLYVRGVFRKHRFTVLAFTVFDSCLKGPVHLRRDFCRDYKLVRIFPIPGVVLRGESRVLRLRIRRRRGGHRLIHLFTKEG